MPLPIGTKVRVRPHVITESYKSAEGIVRSNVVGIHENRVQFSLEVEPDNIWVGFDDSELEILEQSDVRTNPNPTNSPNL